MNYTKIVNIAKNPVVIMVVILVIMLISGTTMVVLNKDDTDNLTILNRPIKNGLNEYIAQSNSKEIPVYSDEVTRAMETYYKYYFDDATLYTNNSFNINDISVKEKIGTALKLINSSNIHFCPNDEEDDSDGILVENFNNVLNTFNIEGNLTIEDIKALEKDYSGKIVVNKITIEPTEEDTIKLYGPCETGFIPEDYIAKKIIKAEKDGDLLYIYEKEAFAEYSSVPKEDETYTVNFYKDYNKTQLLNTINTKVTNPMDDDMNRYNTYKYTFKLVDDTYFLESFALVEN